MNAPNVAHGEQLPHQLIHSGEDLFGEDRSLGISSITFKVTSQGDDGIFIIENTFHQKGGPARHLHYAQDEWFYVLDGEFIMEVGKDTYQLVTGDSLLAPRNIPHVWAYTGEKQGKMLITFMPAGKMESFFREVTKANAMPPQDPSLWRSHGMELLGPPLPV